MTISSTYSADTYAGDDSTTTFAITFEFLSNSNYIQVSKKVDSTGVITLQTGGGTDYSVSGTNVVFTTAPATGETVIIELNPPYKQESDYAENAALPAETLETDLDTRTLESQLAKDNADRALKLDASLSGVSSTIVTSSTNSTNASKFIRFNEDGDGFEVQALSATAGLADLVDDTTPQLGGDLDLNSNDITGTGNINHTGTLTTSGAAATGALTVTGNIAVSGTVDGRDVATDGTKLDTVETNADVTDETNVVSSLDGATLTAATVASTDKVLIQDADASDALKTVTAQSIADLSSGVDAASVAEMEAASSTTVYVSPGRHHRHPASAKGWVDYDLASDSVDASYNVTSVTKNGTGDFTVNWDTDFSSANYCAVATTGQPNCNIQARAAGTTQVNVWNSSDAAADTTLANVVAFGDQ